MDAIDHLAVALGLATLAGFNLYLTALVTGMAIRFQWVDLHGHFEALRVLGEWPVLAAAGILFLVQFIADKIPWVDSLSDMIHTLVRPVGGALLAMGALGFTSPVFNAAIALAAGAAALAAHAFKASLRLAVNHSPEPVSNIAVSVLEDAAVVGGLALTHASPPLALFVFGGFLAIVIYSMPRLFRRIKASLWLFYHKLRAPAGNRLKKAPPEFSAKISSHDDILLSAEELEGRPPDVAWALPALTGRVRGLRDLAPNLFGRLIAENTRPGFVFFAGKKGGSPCLKSIPLADSRISHEPRFLSEDLVIHDRNARRKVTFRFSRSQSHLVDELLRRLEALQTAGLSKAPAVAESPPSAGGAPGSDGDAAGASGK